MKGGCWDCNKPGIATSVVLTYDNDWHVRLRWCCERCAVVLRIAHARKMQEKLPQLEEKLRNMDAMVMF